MLALRVWLCLAIACSTVSAQTLSTIALVAPLTQVTHTATQSGSWSSPQTWGDGIPSTGSRVRIPSGFTVTVDQLVFDAPFWVRVEGVLRFTPSVPTGLTLETLLVMPGGRLELGKVGDPVTATVTLTFLATNGAAIDHDYDPLELSRGLVAGGLVEMHGQPKTAWVTVSQIPPVGSTSIALDAMPAGWQVGDELVFTASTYGQDETFTVTAVAGTTVMLDHAVTYARAFPAGCPECRLHVGNLTRNIRIQSHVSGVGNRLLQGHAMLMGGGHLIRYAGFYDLGRTTIAPVTDPLFVDGVRDPSLCPPVVTQENVRGRYSLHFHNPQHHGFAGPNAPLSIAQGNVVRVQRDAGFKLGFTNHEGNVSFRDNVSYQIDGSHYFNEEGNEIGEFVGNLAVHSKGSDAEKDVFGIDEAPDGVCNAVRERHRLDVGHQGTNYWDHSGGTDFFNNVSASAGAAGFTTWTRFLDSAITGFKLNTYHVTFPIALWWGVPIHGVAWTKGQTAFGGGNVPFRRTGNVSYVTRDSMHNIKACFELKYVGIDQAAKYPQSPYSEFTDALGWNCRTGIATSYAGKVRYRNVKLLQGTAGNPRQPAGGGLGFGLANQGGNSNILENVIINGFLQGISPSSETTWTNVTIDGKPYQPPPTPPKR